MAGALAAPPNDPGFPQQWPLKNVGQAVNGKTGQAGADIAALEAWAIHAGGSPITIAIVGAGVDPHPEFADRLLEGYVTSLAGGDPFSTLDTAGQGTRLAGIMAASADNHTGIAGLNGRAAILPVRVTDGTLGTEQSTAEGISWAADHGADIILVPLQFYDGTNELADAVQRAADAGALVIAPAGDDGEPTVAYPAALPGCLAVSATTSEDALSAFSNWGAEVDLGAPSENVWSTARHEQYAFETRPDAGFAAAFVAGAASLVWSYAPQLSAEQVQEILLSSADDLGPPGWDARFGHGRLNLARALQITEPPPVRFEQWLVFPTALAPYRTGPFTVRIVNGTQRLLGPSAQMIYRTIPGGVAPPLSGTSLGDGLYRFDLPPVPCGVTVEYYYSVRTQSRLTFFEPPDAPISVRSAAAAYPPPPKEDFESDASWVAWAEGEPGTTGEWVRVDPVGTSLGLVQAQPQYDRTPDQGAYCYVTGQHHGGHAGVNDVDGGPVRLMSPPVSALALDAEIRYAAWVFSDQGVIDPLVVEVSTDDAATWTVADTILPTGGWQTRSFRFGSVASSRPDDFRIRFSIADPEFDSLTEAAIDDFEILPLGCDRAGDADFDRDTDYEDWERCVSCLAGPYGILDSIRCQSPDINRDGRVDLRDAAVFQNYFGPEP